MIPVLNFLLSFAVFTTVNLAGAPHLREEGNGIRASLAKRIYHSRVRAAFVNVAAYAYMIISFAIWIGQTDSSVLVMVFWVGLAGCIVIPLDMYLAFRRPLSPTSMYVRVIERHCRQKSEAQAEEIIKALADESRLSENAHAALQELLVRTGHVGNLVRHVLAGLPQND